MTANVLRVKRTWRFTLSHATAHTAAAEAVWADINARTQDSLIRARHDGLLAPDADLEWTRQVYYALLSKALNRPAPDDDTDAQAPDRLATLVIDTLLLARAHTPEPHRGPWSISGAGPRRTTGPLRRRHEDESSAFDRYGRSLQDLINMVAELRGRGIGFTSLHENLDTTTPGGRLVFHVFAALAEFIRELIVIGSKEDLAAARARGRVGGRDAPASPPSRSSAPPAEQKTGSAARTSDRT
ncbi:recombinase family protein [Streptomyces sp. NPDC029006]|uniref:recombinase family protein n=1 Tax=Streptomyces sp. NPDC029006 TaxID=3155467 RepID=UPI0034096289